MWHREKESWKEECSVCLDTCNCIPTAPWRLQCDKLYSSPVIDCFSCPQFTNSSQSCPLSTFQNLDQLSRAMHRGNISSKIKTNTWKLNFILVKMSRIVGLALFWALGKVCNGQRKVGCTGKSSKASVCVNLEERKERLFSFNLDK